MLKSHICCHVTEHVNRSTTHDYLYVHVCVQSQVVAVKMLVASIKNAVLHL
jgi:hypothetical protein